MIPLDERKLLGVRFYTYDHILIDMWAENHFFIKMTLKTVATEFKNIAGRFSRTIWSFLIKIGSVRAYSFWLSENAKRNALF